MKLYVIVAGDGEYSGRIETPKFAYLDRDKAQAMTDLLDKVWTVDCSKIERKYSKETHTNRIKK